MKIQDLLLEILMPILIGCIKLSGCQKDPVLKSLVDDYWSWKMKEFPAVSNPQSHQLESFTVDSFQERVNQCAKFLQKARNVNNASLSHEDLITLKLLQYQLQTYIDGYKWADYGNLNPINMLESVHRLSHIWSARGIYQTFDEYMEYIDKLDKVPAQIEEIRTLLARAVQLNRTNHIVSMVGVVEKLYDAANGNPKETIYYATQFENLDKSIEISESEKSTLRVRGIGAIQRILQSFERLAVWLEQRYIPHTRPNVGVWSLPNGTEYYRNVLKWHLSLDMHPITVHQTGIMEVARIEKKMFKIIEELGFEKTDLTSFLNYLKSDSSFYNHTQGQYLQLYRDAIRNIEPHVPQFFPNLDTIPALRVMPSPKGSLAASYWYSTVQVNTHDPETKPNFTVLTISLHEGLPGHHLQMSYMRNQNLPNFRRVLDSVRKYSAPFHFPYYTAYVEGWGLYAEYLGEEMGVFSNLYDLFGRYCYEIFRACRLVVDTGIHYKGWSRDEAVQYLQKYSIMSRKELELEVDRYITWPGQACSYKIGEIKLKEVRQKAEEALGEEFDIKQFHEAILKVGAVPLDILEDVVDHYINVTMYSCSSSFCASAMLLQCTLLILMLNTIIY